ncbi:MAG: PAS domain-containing protein [Prevotella sp.]|nr:PAS domain-containing protein [Prevotella sp.]
MKMLTHLLLYTQTNDFYAIPLLAWLLVAAVVIAFTVVFILNRIIIRRVRAKSKRTVDLTKMMRHALEISDTHVIGIDLLQDSVYDIHGESVLAEPHTTEQFINYIHPDDQASLRTFLKRLGSGETTTDEMRFRCRWDDRSEWRYVHCTAITERREGFSKPTLIIATMIDKTDIQKEQERISDLTDRYQQIFEQSIIGLSFYDAKGHLLGANRIMREICHFDGETDAFFSSHNLFDLQPVRDNVDRHNVEEFWVCTQSQITEKDMHNYIELRLYPIRDEQGKLMYISIAARDVTEERQIYLQAKLNEQQIQKANEEIQRYETELKYMMEACDMRVWQTSFSDRSIKFYKGLSTMELEMTFDEFETYFVNEGEEIAENFRHPEEHFKEPVSYLCQMRPLFHDTDQLQWNQINSIPVYDKNGRLTGCFGLIRNMSKAIEAQERLKRETERANDSGRMKSVFLANMTHEIRTPLNAIVGFSDLIQTMESSDDKRELIHIIHNNCDMLLRLINDILAISAMDSNGLIMQPEEVDFAQSFDEICQSLAQRVENPNVEFIKDNPYKSLVTSIDNGRIQQVITNFVTNAVKYTHQGHIRVGYHERDNGLYIFCEDTGAGIPKDQCQKVFERFVKLNDYIQGTGLGLSICKAIAERCKGDIGVDSEVGKGSTFWLWIPCDIKTKITRNDNEQP